MPSLVFFTASWCGPCKLMTRVTLTDPTVTCEISNVAHVAMDIDEHQDLASKYSIDAVPTFVLLSSTAEEVNRTTGFQLPGDFLTWLTNGITEAKETTVRRARSQQLLAEVDQMLAATDTNSTRLAATKLFELSTVHEDDVVQAAAVRLKMLASRDPEAVLDGLNDMRLAPRIQAANALRDSLGNAFDIDPWADATIRMKAIEVWRRKLQRPPHVP